MTFKKSSNVLFKKCYFRFKDTNMLKVKEFRKRFHTNSNQKRAGVAVLKSYKMDFKTKITAREKEG